MNLSNFTQEELEKLIFLRANEWSDWPCYLLMGFGQLFLLNTHISTILMIFIITEIIWFFIAEKFVSFRLAYYFYWIHGLAWIISPIVAIKLLIDGHILTSIIALLWFLVLMSISFLIHLLLSFSLKPFKIFPPRIGIIELKMGATIFGLDPNEVEQRIKESNEFRNSL